MYMASSSGGTGAKLTTATIIVCGVASLVASLLSFLYVLLRFRQDRYLTGVDNSPDLYGCKRNLGLDHRSGVVLIWL